MPQVRTPIKLPAAVVLASGSLAAVLAGCGAPSSSADSGTLTVFAAASLNAPFTELAETFEEQHPGTDVRLSFAGSSDLATQISQGAPADVFAAADTRTMARLVEEGLIAGNPQDFATNRLTIAVPPGNPAGIRSFADLARPDVRTVVCAAQVPCGAAAERVEAAAGVDLAPVSEEASVTDVLGKVTSGEADAGLVYVTDVQAAGDAAEGMVLPEADRAVTTYPIAPVQGSGEPELAAAFIALVTGSEGLQVLTDAGFGAP